MSDKKEVERAAEFRRIVRRNALPAACDIERSIDALETGLLLAGLLRTEADRLSAALHGPLADTRYDGDGPWLSSSNGSTTVRFKTNDAAQRFHSALSALALHVRPKSVERWTVERVSGGYYAVRKSHDCIATFPPDAEPEARAYVARKNAEERAK